MRTVLITGGAGFIGSHVARRFFSERVRVIVVDNLAAGRHSVVPVGVDFYQMDVRAPGIRGLIRSAAPDVVLHFAADANAVQTASSSIRSSSDVGMSRDFFHAVRDEAPGARVVFASTVAADTIPDSGELSPYAAGKHAVEQCLGRLGAGRSGHISLRFANVYGPGQTGSSAGAVVPSFCHAILAGTPMMVFGDGHQTRDFIHVSDIAEAVWRAAWDSGGADCLTIATGMVTPVGRVGELLSAAAGVPAAFLMSLPRCNEVLHSQPDPRPAMQALGWEPRIRLAAGLAGTLAWFRQHHAKSLVEKATGPLSALGAGHVDNLAADHSGPVH